MNQYLNETFGRYQHAGILIDTNILLLYFIGLCSRQQIPEFKRTKQFTIEDFDLLVQIWNFFNKVVTTPHILTEVNSLANQLSQNYKSEFYTQFTSSLELIEAHHQSAKTLSQNETFSRFGLTDTGIIQLVQGKYLVLTDDFRLSQYLSSIQVDAINFNHIRAYNWS